MRRAEGNARVRSKSIPQPSGARTTELALANDRQPGMAPRCAGPGATARAPEAPGSAAGPVGPHAVAQRRPCSPVNVLLGVGELHQLLLEDLSGVVELDRVYDLQGPAAGGPEAPGGGGIEASQASSSPGGATGGQGRSHRNSAKSSMPMREAKEGRAAARVAPSRADLAGWRVPRCTSLFQLSALSYTAITLLMSA
jgi:hypothetical protein